MPDLVIYHPGTGTAIPLSDAVYLVNVAHISKRDLEALENGTLDKFDMSVIGTRIDNSNMGNIFYPEGSRNV